jgi:hypothetical protein
VFWEVWGVSSDQILEHRGISDRLSAAGASWRVVSRELGIGVGTACRALQSRSKNLPEFALASA